MKMSGVCFLTWLIDCLDCLNFPLNIWMYHAIYSVKTIFDLFVFVESNLRVMMTLCDGRKEYFMTRCCPVFIDSITLCYSLL
jgi:hypothetical protein